MEDLAFGPYLFRPVGVVRSCYKAKFGIPRQPGLVPEARGEIRLLDPCNQADAVRGLERFSHIWVLFVFHAAMSGRWKPTVRPPRLGGDARVGVFASRSPFRPCPIGLSVVRLERVEVSGRGRVALEVSGLDLLDGTPVLDVKPYLPYSDVVPDAVGGFAAAPPREDAIRVTVGERAEEQFAELERKGMKTFRGLACKVIAADPRPAYQREPGRVYGVFLERFEVVWQVGADPLEATVLEIRKAAPAGGEGKDEDTICTKKENPPGRESSGESEP